MRNEKSKELKAFEDQQKTEHYRQGDETNRRVRDTCTTKTFWVGMLLMFCFTTAYHWNLGYPVASIFGIMPEGTLSGAAEHEELVKRRATTALAMGLLFDNNKYLAAANLSELRPKLKIEFVKMAIDTHRQTTLKWIQNQPDWESGLSAGLVRNVKSPPEIFAGHRISEWRNKYIDIKKHHHEDSLKAIRAWEKNQAREAHQQNTLELCYALIWDDLKYLDKVKFEMLPDSFLAKFNKLYPQLIESGKTNIIGFLQLDGKKDGQASSKDK